MDPQTAEEKRREAERLANRVRQKMAAARATDEARRSPDPEEEKKQKPAGMVALLALGVAIGIGLSFFLFTDNKPELLEKPAVENLNVTGDARDYVVELDDVVIKLDAAAADMLLQKEETLAEEDSEDEAAPPGDQPTY